MLLTYFFNNMFLQFLYYMNSILQEKCLLIKLAPIWTFLDKQL